jgi:hypothetical protein
MKRIATTSLEIVEFCIVHDETINYFKREFAIMRELND